MYEGSSVPGGLEFSGRLPGAFHAAGSSSFTEFLTRVAPELLPGRRPLPAGLVVEGAVPHATTIVALSFADGVLMGGDRRATMGNLIAQRDIEKVFAADAYTLVGIAGTAGIGLEVMRLFQVQLEHYEKIEGTMLSLDGKANQLATMIRNNLGAALQGLAVIPLYAGVDLDARSAAEAGRIFSFDVAGGVYEEHGYDSIGSGSLFAKSSMKKRYRPGLSAEEAARVAIEGLFDAADDDTATGGPDLIRRIFPVIMVATAEGTRRFTDEETAGIVESIVAERRENPGA
jgi:proteasome beta subunit